MFLGLEKVLGGNKKNKWTEFYKILEENNCIIKDYLIYTENQDINEAMKNINEMSLREIYIWLTWILRGERFCSGLFEEKIKDGTLAKLIDRGKSLTMPV